ncbi:class A beta-lactamase-related serine hydrolase [Bifidobacterium amazonense]|uniref:Class A beta-lactamase-related serine hydrolase n=1 Tax=Bifidobacterium amazonense TaxID=2809027 RepID=A0ABS9VUE0_9BIFI|nr:serine hydrolase [Bifidobacterium amazonense]MCH9275702.1 class A beta-lactamase-related serine hydrolase [Bifidobacterium amazonense]MCH9275714.1 class A beta-lactamase-related serine hydrolase [Bifidobacterium amazonense]
MMRTWAANLVQSPVYRRRVLRVAGATLAVTVAMCGGMQYLWRDAAGDSATVTAKAKQATKTAKSSKTSQDSSAAEAQAKPTPTETALDGIGQIDGSAQVSTVGFTLDTDTQVQLEDELNTFAAYGYGVSFVLVDMTSGKTLASYADAARYSASAIKGPYVLSLAETGTIDLTAAYEAATDDDATTQYLIDQTITVSNNDTYKELHDTYGTDAFATWAKSAGVSVDVTQGSYLNMSAADLARMWAKGYGYLFGSADTGSADTGSAGSDGADSADGDASAGTSTAGSGSAGTSADNTTQTASDLDSAARQWLAGEYSDTLNSTIHMALGGQYSVYTKAGWINGEGDYYALNDAGIVRSSSGDYVLAVMTSAADEYELVSGLVSMLDTIHSASMTA